MNRIYDKTVDDHYYPMKSYSSESNELTEMKHKLDDVLRVVREIDQRLKNQIDPPPPLPRITESPKSLSSPPPLPPVNVKNRFTLRSPTRSNQPKQAANYEDIPPPRPPKSGNMIEPLISPDGTLTLSSSQCLCLTLQLKAVRMFIDENFEDEYVDKEPNMVCLDSTIRTLSGYKTN